ncbi:PemK-like, MazF-like toxin of type II toxin-antitoxin system [Agreia sp. VKM Ac-1783]|nr:PemK-like, MazF-like toxin of type II toxin-antitoxin system [Agreia sp. VKM Ac-1783]
MTRLFSAFGTREPERSDSSRSRTVAPSPGRSGSEATIEVAVGALGRRRLAFEPRVDGKPDPGEVVWTWVPYEENDGRGKDRPVLIVARDSSRSVLALQLTSKPHDRDAQHFVFVGPGPWDSQVRPSWVRLDRVFRVFESGMRREASSVSRTQFAAVSSALKGLRS